MVVADGAGLPVGYVLAPASPAEVTLAEETLDAVALDAVPQRLVADKAYDSDRLRDALQERGIELICPHRAGRKRPPRQDGRALRRYKRRWKVERAFAWLSNYRRLCVRWEFYPRMFHAFVTVALIMITLNRF